MKYKVFKFTLQSSAILQKTSEISHWFDYVADYVADYGYLRGFQMRGLFVWKKQHRISHLITKQIIQSNDILQIIRIGITFDAIGTYQNIMNGLSC